MYCPKCGNDIGDAEYCSTCDTKVNEKSKDSSKKPSLKTIIAIVAIAVVVVIGFSAAVAGIRNTSSGKTSNAIKNSNYDYDNYNENKSLKAKAKKHKINQTVSVGDNFEITVKSCKVIGPRIMYTYDVLSSAVDDRPQTEEIVSSSDGYLLICATLKNISPVDVVTPNKHLNNYIDFEVVFGKKFSTALDVYNIYKQSTTSFTKKITPLQTVDIELYFPISNEMAQTYDSLVLYPYTAADETDFGHMKYGLKKTETYKRAYSAIALDIER